MMFQVRLYRSLDLPPADVGLNCHYYVQTSVFAHFGGDVCSLCLMADIRVNVQHLVWRILIKAPPVLKQHFDRQFSPILWNVLIYRKICCNKFLEESHDFIFFQLST